METASRSADAQSGAAQNLPSAEEFQAIYTKMAEAALLAETFSPPAVSRGDRDRRALRRVLSRLRGEGSAGPGPIPVRFGPLHRQGRAGRGLSARLSVSSNLPKIKLIGHTDPVGSDDFNDGLSLRRAEAVKDYLEAGGYHGEHRRSRVTANPSRSSRSIPSATTPRRSTSSTAASSLFATRTTEMPRRGLRRTALVGLAASSVLGIAADRAAADVHALVVGINDYTGGPPKLKGAVNDANDVAAALRASGVTDVTRSHRRRRDAREDLRRLGSDGEEQRGRRSPRLHLRRAWHQRP